MRQTTTLNQYRVKKFPNKGRKDEKIDIEDKQSDGRDLGAAEDAAERQPLLKMFLFQSLFTPIVSLSLVKHCCRSFYRKTSPGQPPFGSSLQSTVYKPPEYFRLLECDFLKGKSQAYLKTISKEWSQKIIINS